MSGDSFCKEMRLKGIDIMYNTFNPHVWGLFLQDTEGATVHGDTTFAFNPHVWGLFLQD